MTEHDTDDSANEIPQSDRITNIQIGAEPGDERFAETGCTATTHEGRPVIAYLMGPTDQAVRKINLCSACEMVLEERSFPAVSGITLEGVGGVRDRITNYPNDDLTTVKFPLDEVLTLREHDEETATVTHTGVIERTNELMMLLAEDNNAD